MCDADEWLQKTNQLVNQLCEHDLCETGRSRVRKALGEHLRTRVVPVAIHVDALAQEIRRVDGNHSLGAGALAEALMPFLNAARPSQQEREAWDEALSPDALRRLGVWLCSNDTGISSRTLAAVALGVRQKMNTLAAPWDSSDFGRCYRLVQANPRSRPPFRAWRNSCQPLPASCATGTRW